MKIVNTFKTAEIPKPHPLSVRALLANDSTQFEHLSHEPPQIQEKQLSNINVYLYILDGTDVLDSEEKTIPLFADVLMEIPPEIPCRLINISESQLLLINIKAPRPTNSTQIVLES